MDLSYGIPALYLNCNNNGRRSTLSALVLPRMLSNDSYAALSERVKYRERGLICPSVRAVDQCLTPKEPNAAYPIGLAAGYSFSFPVSTVCLASAACMTSSSSSAARGLGHSQQNLVCLGRGLQSRSGRTLGPARTRWNRPSSDDAGE